MTGARIRGRAPQTACAEANAGRIAKPFDPVPVEFELDSANTDPIVELENLATDAHAVDVSAVR